MESSRSASRSRRSYPNVNNLTIAPLSAKYPLDGSVPPSPDDDDDDDDYDSASRQARTSYIVQKSAPTTPGILSLSQSRSNSRQRARKSYAYNGYFIDTSVRVLGDVPKAKSTSTLFHHAVDFADQVANGIGGEPPAAHGRHHTRKLTAPRHRHHTSEASQEWLHRAGLAIASESRDSKGQGWLVRRASSTSLVSPPHDYDHAAHEPQRMALLSGESLPDDEYPTSLFSSPRLSRAGSRIASRAPSARPSRRPSRTDLRAARAEAQDLHTRLPEPEFLDAHEQDRFEAGASDGDESDGDEVRVARLARERAAGLGGWMEKLIGWSLFSVEERGEASSGGEEDEENEWGAGIQARGPRLADFTAEELQVKREAEARRRRREREAVVAAAAVKAPAGGEGSSGPPSTGDGRRGDEEEGGWQDAAWLLSVASKALLS